jgi:hypothetical protein
MNIQDSQTIIKNFVNRIRLYWQVVFLISVLCWGYSFFHHMSSSPPVDDIRHFSYLNWGSFFIAFFLAVNILRLKRKYFRLRYFENFLENEHAVNPELDEQQLVRRLLIRIGTLMKQVWIMGGALVLLGVIYYWITLESTNMNVYFVVGLYSLIINYPRRELFGDIPYLIREILKSSPTGEGDSE